jgi:hypothetical protein
LKFYLKQEGFSKLEVENFDWFVPQTKRKPWKRAKEKKIISETKSVKQLKSCFFILAFYTAFSLAVNIFNNVTFGENYSVQLIKKCRKLL